MDTLEQQRLNVYERSKLKERAPRDSLDDIFDFFIDTDRDMANNGIDTLAIRPGHFFDEPQSRSGADTLFQSDWLASDRKDSDSGFSSGHSQSQHLERYHPPLHDDVSLCDVKAGYDSCVFPSRTFSSPRTSRSRVPSPARNSTTRRSRSRPPASSSTTKVAKARAKSASRPRRNAEPTATMMRPSHYRPGNGNRDSWTQRMEAAAEKLQLCMRPAQSRDPTLAAFSQPSEADVEAYERLVGARTDYRDGTKYGFETHSTSPNFGKIVYPGWDDDVLDEPYAMSPTADDVPSEIPDRSYAEWPASKTRELDSDDILQILDDEPIRGAPTNQRPRTWSPWDATNAMYEVEHRPHHEESEVVPGMRNYSHHQRSLSLGKSVHSSHFPAPPPPYQSNTVNDLALAGLVIQCDPLVLLSSPPWQETSLHGYPNPQRTYSPALPTHDGTIHGSRITTINELKSSHTKPSEDHHPPRGRQRGKSSTRQPRSRSNHHQHRRQKSASVAKTTASRDYQQSHINDSSTNIQAARPASDAAAATTTTTTTTTTTKKEHQQQKRKNKITPTTPAMTTTTTITAPATDGFVNYTPHDSHTILGGVAPSGSSKTKARREKKAAEERRKLSLAARRAVLEAGGDLAMLEEGGLLAA